MSEEIAVAESQAKAACQGCGQELTEDEVKHLGGKLCDLCLFGNSSVDEIEADLKEELERVKPIPGTFTQTSLKLKADLTREEWVEVGRSLRSMARGIQFWVGDWLAYGEARFNEEAYAELERADQTLANWATVARKVAPSRRREDVAFSHHAAVASLPPEKQTEVLKDVKSNHLTVRDTYERVEQEHKKTAETDAARNGRKPQTEKVYEYCSCCGAPESAWSRRPHEVTS